MESLGACGTMLACVLTCACSAIPIVLMVYMGIYAFNNPDSDAWHGVVEGGEFKLCEDEAAAQKLQAANAVDIHGRFVAWFLWGSLVMLPAPIIAGLVAFLAMLVSPALGTFCSTLFGCAVSCGGLAWWITGIVWRFRSDGAYASGDYVPEGTSVEAWEQTVEAEGSLFQYHSGKFMFIYYVICWSFMACSCSCSLLAALWGCIAAKSA